MNYVHHNNKAPYGETHTIITEDASAYVMITIFSEREHIAAIHDLAVLKERRGEGLGSAILEEAILEAERMGAKVAVIGCEKNSWLEEWYTRHGFETIEDEDVNGQTAIMKRIL